MLTKDQLQAGPIAECIGNGLVVNTDYGTARIEFLIDGDGDLEVNIPRQIFMPEDLLEAAEWFAAVASWLAKGGK